MPNNNDTIAAIATAPGRGGIGVVRVSGKLVRALMRGILGGEASGHVICRHKASTGDGLMTALLLLEVMAESGRTLAELVGDLHRFPQKTINVRVARNARALLQDVDVQAARLSVECKLGDHGRLVLRASGTEPLIRVTVEARDSALVETQATLLADAVRRAAAAAANVEAA